MTMLLELSLSITAIEFKLFPGLGPGARAPSHEPAVTRGTYDCDLPGSGQELAKLCQAPLASSGMRG